MPIAISPGEGLGDEGAAPVLNLFIYLFIYFSILSNIIYLQHGFPSKMKPPDGSHGLSQN